MRKLNLLAASVFAATATFSMQASAASKVCVFDILGAQGDVTGMMKDYVLAAKGMGGQIELKTYTDERTAAEDFKAGQCDGVMLTGLRGRQFNDFTGSLDSLGAIPSNKIMEKALATLANPALASKMVQGKYEVAGIAPAGAAFLFVKDRSINSVEKLAGKKIAVFDYDKSQAKMVQKIGAQPVSSDITNFAAKFNNGAVDIVAAPALAYKPLEMYKGLGKNGAIVRFPIVQLTFQLIINKEKFPADFGQKSRVYWNAQTPRAMGIVNKAEKDIPAGVWMDLPEKDKDGYIVLLRDARIALTKEGIYNPFTMKVLKKTRCSVNGADAECSQNLE
ncbi:putative solute-binding protein [Perlucidibaca aquatica]|uniref:putative solute-binding protein n=1 Tax=Perlucidibaca aquatica TaxID=1852776 RepID=UPI00083A7AC0|nr:putative solute-binding protein [Perlucidibaca aquatica]